MAKVDNAAKAVVMLEEQMQKKQWWCLKNSTPEPVMKPSTTEAVMKTRAAEAWIMIEEYPLCLRGSVEDIVAPEDILIVL